MNLSQIDIYIYRKTPLHIIYMELEFHPQPLWDKVGGVGAGVVDA